jgi:hypothetical protein
MTYPDHFRSLLTISDHFQSFPTISDDFKQFPMIFTFGRHLVLVAAPNSAPRSTPTVQYTIAESIGMSGY